MKLRSLLHELEHGATVRQVVEACLEEDHRLIQKSGPTDRTNYRLSRVAKNRFDSNRQVYKMAMRQWQRSPAAKAFYRRLARWNRMHGGVLGKFKSRGYRQESEALKEFFQLIVDQFAGRQDVLAQLAEFAGHLVDGILTESSSAWITYYHYGPSYYDWYAGFKKVLAHGSGDDSET